MQVMMLVEETHQRNQPPVFIPCASMSAGAEEEKCREWRSSIVTPVLGRNM